MWGRRREGAGVGSELCVAMLKGHGENRGFHFASIHFHKFFHEINETLNLAVISAPPLVSILAT